MDDYYRDDEEFDYNGLPWGDMDPYKWSLKNWAIFLFKMLIPTTIVVGWIVFMVTN